MSGLRSYFTPPVLNCLIFLSRLTLISTTALIGLVPHAVAQDTDVPARHERIQSWTTANDVAQAQVADGNITWSFDAFDRTFTIEAEPNTDLLSQLPAAQQAEILAANNLLRGKLVGNGDSWVRLNRTADEISGMIWDGQEYWVIDTVAGTDSTAGTSSATNTVIYAYLDSIDGGFICGTSGDNVQVDPVDPMDVEHLIEMVQGDPQAASLALKIVVVEDQFWSGDTYGIFNTVDGIYRDQVGVALQIASVEQTSLNADSSGALLDEFTNYLGNRSRVGLGHLLTGRNLNRVAGIAYVNALCRGTGLSTQQNQTVTIVAHEIGHNFGSSHDQDTGCGTGKIMDAFVSGSTTFSSCSLNSMAGPVARASCLVPIEEPPGGGGSDACNLLENGSLDANTSGWSSNTTPTIVSDSAAGSGAMTWSGGSVSTMFRAFGDTNYTIKGFTKGPNTSGWAGIGIDFLDSAGNEVGESFQALQPASSYTALNLFARAPANTNFARIWIYASSTRTLFVDELNVRSGNLLANGNFESSTNGWFSNTTLERTTDSSEGQQAMRYTGGSASTRASVQAGTNYRFSGRYKSTGDSSWSGFGIDYLNAAGVEIGEEVKTLPPSTGYTNVSLTGTVPAGATSIRLWIYTPSSRTLTLDNLQIRDASCEF